MALLDSMLAENFHAAYRQKRSGVLTAEGGVLTMRFCFQDGSPIAIDLGDHKDRLLAMALRDYNRLTEEQLNEVLSQWQDGRAPVADLVVANSYASEEEVGRTTQAMVEDCLCRFFTGKISQVSMDDQKTIDGFDFDSQAFRLKIDAEILLRTVDTRVADIRTIQQEFGNFEAIFAFNEDSPGSGTLNDYEKRILDFVDGKTPIHEIAILFRDSSLNTARTLSQLAAKRIIRRLSADNVSQLSSPTSLQRAFTGPPPVTQPVASATRTATAATATAAAAAMRESTPTMRDFTPYRHTIAEEPQSRFMTVVLGFVLVLLCVVGVLIYQASVRRAEFAAMSAKLEDAISQSDWAKGAEQIESARVKAGKDLSAQGQVQTMEVRYQAALSSQLTTIDKLCTEGEYRQAVLHLAKMPGDQKVEDMRTKVTRSEATSRRRAQDLLLLVNESLDKDDGAHAATVLAESALVLREKKSATDALDRWRLIKLEMANSGNALFTKRLSALSLVRASDPPARLAEQIAQIESDINRQKIKISEQLAQVKDMLDKGNLLGVEVEIKRLDLHAQIAGTTLEIALKELESRVAEIHQVIASTLKFTTDALAAIEKPEQLTSAEKKAQDLTTSSLTGVAEKASQCVDVLRQVAKISTEESPDQQALALLPIQDQKSLDSVLVDALKQRSERLRALEGIAGASIDNARVMASDGKVEEAVTLLENVLSRPELRTTIVRVAAVQELEQLKSRLVRRATLKDMLKVAIANGDVATGTAIAREMGLKYLPLSIESLPSGAEVWHEGKQVGTTPLVLDISAADRVDYQIELKAQGFISASASGAKAEAGWRLMVRMERNAILSAKLGGLVTNHPAVIDGQVIAASRSAIGTLDAAGKTHWLSFASSGVESPVYAAVSAIGSEMYVATRDQVALALSGKSEDLSVRRVSLTGRTDFAINTFKSTLIVDRRYLIIAGLDGALHAADDHDPQIGWEGPSGAQFMCGPAVVGDVVIGVRKDGIIERLQADDGKSLSSESLGVPVVSAWVTSKGLAGYTLNELFEYDGVTLIRTTLPQTVANGAENVVITPSNRVLVRSTTGDRAWDEVGRLEEKITGNPLVWFGHAVIPSGSTLLVFGKRGFKLVGKSEFLSPVILKDRLVAITQDGDIQQFDP